ncbi:MAG: protein kinase [Planctomycetota bacterium]|nr:protein kinase [Planctomycetota bacterium]
MEGELPEVEPQDQEYGRPVSADKIEAADAAEDPNATDGSDEEGDGGDPLLSKIVGGCRLSEQLGAGDQGLVYKGRHEGMGMEVVVKIIPQSLPGFRESQIERFLHAGRSMARLNLPHVVRVFNVGKERDLNFVVMEYIKGITLRALLKEKGTLDEEQSKDIAEQILQALEAAHAQNVIHRDVKPSNVLLGEKPGGDGYEVKLADLGLAKFNLTDAGGENAPVTVSGVMMGQADYIAPEQAQDAKNVTFSADIYSLGCMMYEMLIGRKPYEAKSAVQVMLMHVQAKVPNAAETNPDIDPRLARFIRKMMAKQPDKRFESATEALRAIRRLQGKRVAAPRVARKVEEAPAATPAVEAATTAPVAPTAPVSTAPLEVDRLPEQAKARHEIGQIGPSLGKLEKALAKDQDHAGAKELKVKIEPEQSVHGIDQKTAELKSAIAEKKLATAMALVGEILKSDPTNAEASRARVQCQANLQQAGQLVAQLKIVAETNDLISIQSLCDNVLHKNSEDPVALVLKAETDEKLAEVNRHLEDAAGHRKAGRWQQAVTSYKATLAIWDFCPDAQAGLKAASAALEKSAGINEEAESLISAGKLAEAEALLIKGSAGAGPEAQELLASVQQKKSEAESLLAQANEKKSAKLWADAVEASEQALELWPANEAAQWVLGESRSSLKAFKKATARARDLIEAKDLQAAETAINDAIGRGQWNEAEALLSKVKDRQGQVADLIARAKKSRDQRNWAELSEHVAKAAEIWPTNVELVSLQQAAAGGKNEKSECIRRAEALMRERKLTSAVPAIRKALSLGAWPEGEEFLEESISRLSESESLIKQAASSEDSLVWRIAVNKLQEARVINTEAVDESRIEKLKEKVADLDHQLGWLRDRAEEGRYMDVVAEARELQKKASDIELEKILGDAQGKEKQVKSMEQKARELIEDLDPAAAVQLFQRIVQLQPFRQESLEKEITGLKLKVDKAKQYFEEARKHEENEEWNKVLEKINLGLAIDRHLIGGKELKEEAEREGEADIRAKKMMKTIAILGAVVAAILTIAFFAFR